MQSHKAFVPSSLSPYVGEDNSLCTISIEERATQILSDIVGQDSVGVNYWEQPCGEELGCISG